MISAQLPSRQYLEKKGEPMFGPPFLPGCTSCFALHQLLRPCNRSQTGRGLVLNHLYLLLGGYADRGRDNKSAHVAAVFCGFVDNRSRLAQFEAVSVTLFIVRTQQFDSEIGDTTGRRCFERNVVRNGGYNELLRGVDECHCCCGCSSGGNQAQKRPSAVGAVADVGEREPVRPDLLLRAREVASASSRQVRSTRQLSAGSLARIDCRSVRLEDRIDAVQSEVAEGALGSERFHVPVAEERVSDAVLCRGELAGVIGDEHAVDHFAGTNPAVARACSAGRGAGSGLPFQWIVER